MFFTALCTDNSKFWSTGKISVRVFKYSGMPLFVKGKPTNYDDLKTLSVLRETSRGDKDIEQDFEAMVFTPLGGGKNYGLFMLPQINSKGIVTFLDGDFSKPLWVGSFFGNRYDSNGLQTGNINIPNDKPEEEGTNKDGIIGGEKKISGNESTIILRTRHTESSDEGVDWEKQNTENLVSIGDSLVRLRHNTMWSNNTIKKYQETMIYKDSNNSDKETIQLDVNNIDGKKRGYLKLTEDSFKIILTNGNTGDTTIFEINVSGSAINFVDQFGNEIIGDQNGLTINSDSGNNKYINLNGNVVSLVTYDQLKIIADSYAKHIHYGKTNSLITSGPANTNKSDVNIEQAIKKMEAEYLKTEQK